MTNQGSALSSPWKPPVLQTAGLSRMKEKKKCRRDVPHSLEDKPPFQSQTREAAWLHSIHFSIPVRWNHLHSSLKNCCFGQRKHRGVPLCAKFIVQKQQLCSLAVRQEQYLQRWNIPTMDSDGLPWKRFQSRQDAAWPRSTGPASAREVDSPVEMERTRFNSEIGVGMEFESEISDGCDQLPRVLLPF